jgi:hypothetical protein
MKAHMRKYLLVSLALLLVPSVSIAKEKNPLIGKWTGGNEFSKTTLTFLPDGRYFAETDTVGVKTSNQGTYTYKGDTMTAKDASKTIVYRLAFKDTHMTMTSEESGTTEWDKLKGSEKAVVEEMKQRDAAAAKEDAKWIKKIPTATVTPGPVAAIGDMPADPKPDDYFKDATVFKSAEGYIWLSSTRYNIVQGADPGNGQSQCRYFFYGTGRVFARNYLYQSSGGDRVSVNTIQKWGKYRINGNPTSGETVEIVFDDGEKETDKLLHGRRSLVGEHLTLNNVKFETEALDKALEAK